MELSGFFNRTKWESALDAKPQVSIETCFQQLANQTMNCPDGERPPQLLLFQGGGKEAGVSTLSRLYAKYLSEKIMMRVLLVDANFLCPTVHSIYNIPLKPGFAEYLEGNADARIIHAVGNNLSVMASGDKSLLPRTLLSGQAGFRTRLRDLCKDYDIVLVDAAPITVCPETFSLATGTDGVIFVVKSEKTRKAVVQASLEQLRLARARILGGILNFRQFHIPSWLYN